MTNIYLLWIKPDATWCRKLIHWHLKQPLQLWPWEEQWISDWDSWWWRQGPAGWRHTAEYGDFSSPEGHSVGWWHQALVVWDLGKLLLLCQWGADTDSAIPKWRLTLLMVLHTLGYECRKSQSTVRPNIRVTSRRRDSCSLATVKSSCESELNVKLLHMVCWSTKDGQ